MTKLGKFMVVFIGTCAISLALTVWFYFLGNTICVLSNLPHYFTFGESASMVLLLLMIRTAYTFIFKVNLTLKENNNGDI